MKSRSGKRGQQGGRVAVRLAASTPLENSPDQSDSAGAGLRRADDVRRNILRAALECFGAFGFEGTSTRAIAERAGVTHTLVNYHFGSKEELWIATMDNALSGYVKSIENAMAESEDQSAAAALRIFIDQFVRLSAATPQMHRILTMESNQGTDRLNWVIENYLRTHFTTVRDLIRKGQLEGQVREGDPARIYYHIIGAGGTPFTIATEYKVLTGRDIFSEAEILRTIAFIYEIVFT